MPNLKKVRGEGNIAKFCIVAVQSAGSGIKHKYKQATEICQFSCENKTIFAVMRKLP